MTGKQFQTDFGTITVLQHNIQNNKHTFILELHEHQMKVSTLQPNEASNSQLAEALKRKIDTEVRSGWLDYVCS